MNPPRALRTLALGLTLWLAAATAARAQTGGVALTLVAEGPVTPVMASYIQRGIATAENQNAEVVIIQLNTPGGQLDLMQRVVDVMLQSRVPVVVYVSPRGAMAGSAGTIITLAAQANAMAPDTVIGAASPVGSQGENIDSTLSAKLKSVLKAQVRNLAAARSPEAIALAEQTIDEAKAATAAEARAVGLTDFIAADVPDLLRQLDGYTVRVQGREVTLHTANATVTPLPASLLEEALALLTNPNVVFLLLALGTQAILIELASPGGWVAGFIGAISLALAFYGLGVLPVNWFGLVFIVLAFALFIIDINAPTHGALTAAAVGSIIVGALVLFNSPGSSPYFRVSIPLVVGTALAFGGMFSVILVFALRAQKRPVIVGTHTVVGQVGRVQQPLTPEGTVQVAGELWSAESDGEPIAAGEKVEVVEVKGLRLKVR
ncbi:MAG: nodulation protein NfeD, partial [Chloroflexi bacterium]|nr:nodulation protein NfeD [Chloroflexota bacterium]